MTLTILDLNASIDTLERSLAVIVSSLVPVLKTACCETGHSSGSTELIATSEQQRVLSIPCPNAITPAKIRAEARQVNEYIFREYDIRGVVDRDLTDEVVR